MNERIVVVSVLLLAAAGCMHRPGLSVTHTPNPSGIREAVIPEGRPFPNLWFYRTEVRNDTDHPIRITRFEGWFLRDSRWVAANVLERPLDAKDFSEWYVQGVPVTNGWIPPRASAVCDPNWHGVTSPVSPRCKWTYEGVDAAGRVYRAESEIRTLPAPPR